MHCGAQTGCAEVLLQILIYGLSNGAALALMAVGVTVVYGTVRTLNLAHGDVFALTSVLTTSLVTGLGLQPDWPPSWLLASLVLIFAAALAFGALLSVGIEQAAFKPFRGRSRLAPLIATLGLSFVLYQGALFWRTTLRSWIPGDHRSVPGLPEVPTDGIPDLLPNLNLIKALGLPLHITFRASDLFVIVVSALCTLGCLWFLQRTRTGRAIRACAQNPEMAQLCGVDLDGTIRWAFAFGGALAGAAGFVFALYYARPFGQHGAQSGLLAFAAAILGGVGNPLGALVSGVGLGVFTAYSDFFFAAQWTPVLLQLLLIALLIARSGAGEDDALAVPSREVLTTGGPAARRDRRWWLAALGLALLYPVLDRALGLQLLVIVTGLAALVMLALGLNLVLGIAGILDLGFAVSYGLGGYVVALLAPHWGPGGPLSQPLDFVVLLALGALLAGAFGALKGELTRRLRADDLAVASLALGFIMGQVILNLSDFTGGVGGVAALPAPRLLGYSLPRPVEQYYLALALVLALVWASRRLIRSRLGRGWAAIAADPLAAASIGLNTTAGRTMALAAGSAMAGMAGALYAGTFAYVSPEMVAFHVSAMILAMTILGGNGSVAGAVLGALLIGGYDRVVIPRLGPVLAQLLQGGNLGVHWIFDLRATSYLNFGLALYLTILYRGRKS